MRISDWSSDVCSSDLTLLSNAWLAALARDNVELVDAPVRRIVEDGVEMQDGTRHRVDAIVYGTGFAATQFLAPMDIAGIDGRSIHERRSEEHTSELQSLMRISYAVFRLKKKTNNTH